MALAGASWVLIFPALRAVIMQALQGAREVLTASRSRRQSQPFMSFSACSLPNESLRLILLAQPLPDAGYQDAIFLLKRLSGGEELLTSSLALSASSFCH